MRHREIEPALAVRRPGLRGAASAGQRRLRTRPGAGLSPLQQRHERPAQPPLYHQQERGRGDAGRRLGSRRHGVLRGALGRIPAVVGRTAHATRCTNSAMRSRRKASVVAPLIEPMLAKIADEIPPEGEFLYEPKWDGFRAIVFRGADVFIQSRDLRPFDRYFPDLHGAFLAQLPEGCVVDGEIVIVTSEGLDFDALQMRLHPAASRVEKLARETPASFVAFDVLAVESRDLRGHPQAERRRELESLLARAKPPLYLTPVTTDRKIAQAWLKRFEGT